MPPCRTHSFISRFWAWPSRGRAPPAERWGCDLLKGIKHWWLYGRENLPDCHRKAFAAVTSQAWAIKETPRGLWDYQTTTWAGKFFGRWFGWAKRSKLTRMADMIKARIDNVVSYCRHGITNGVAEGLNSKTISIKRKSASSESAAASATARTSRRP